MRDMYISTIRADALTSIQLTYQIFYRRLHRKVEDFYYSRAVYELI